MDHWNYILYLPRKDTPKFRRSKAELEDEGYCQLWQQPDLATIDTFADFASHADMLEEHKKWEIARVKALLDVENLTHQTVLTS